MICPFCKEKIPIGSDFCIYCGTDLTHSIEDDDYEDLITVEENEIEDYQFIDDDFDEDFTDDYDQYDDSFDDYCDDGWGDGTDGDYNN